MAISILLACNPSRLLSHENQPTVMITLTLERLKQGIDGISEGFGMYMAECAAYMFMVTNHKSGVAMKIKTENQKLNAKVEWEISRSRDLDKSMRDEQRPTDFGAMGVAVLSALELTDYHAFETSRKGEGVDFWVLKDADDELDFSQSIRVEVSGIKSETSSNTLQQRFNRKNKQRTQSDHTGTDAYISITEFSTPKSVFVKV